MLTLGDVQAELGKVTYRQGWTFTAYQHDHEGTWLRIVGPVPHARFHVDHDHGTGLIRGLLHDACNKGIGMLGDDWIRCLKAATYLKAADYVQANYRVDGQQMAAGRPNG